MAGKRRTPREVNVDVNEVIAELSYKPGWTFREERGWLHITAEVIHSETFQPVTFNIQRIIPRIAMVSHGDFLSWWEDILLEAEFHELREFARYKGELIDNPHISEPVHE